MTETDTYDVAVLGGTPGGIAAGVRAARDGAETLLISYNCHLGGMMAGGLSYTDTLIQKPRAPILQEFVDAARDHYAENYGEDSEQYEFCEGGYIFEPHVAEDIFDRLVADESNLTLLRAYRLVSAERTGRTVRSLRIEPFDPETGERRDGDERRVEADVFVEATYEGDLAATVGVPYRIGRESRSEYDEQFAGRLFTGIRGDRFYPREAVGNEDDSAPADRRGPLDVAPEKRRGDLDITPHPAGLTEIFPGSTGEGDDAIQAYNYRLCLSRNPENRRRPEKPERYDRDEFLRELPEIEESGLRSYLLLRYLPNEKADMNSADLPGENHDYPEADWEERAEQARRHREYALGLLYFLQNDEAVPDEIREDAREWGLARDEFTETDNFPWQLYVREARRIEGRYTFTENDARHAPGLDRTPVHADSVAVAEYPLDSHACHEERRLGSQPEGFFYASQVTRPSQVPYRALLPKGVDNLVVPVPLSSTHVSYGTIRLEPTWLHIGESAGVAAAIAVETGDAPARLDPSHVQRRLVDSGVTLSFFNDVDAETDAAWAPAVQYLGTKGFFADYDARPTASLSESVAEVWASAAAELREEETVDASALAHRLPSAEASGSAESVTGDAFAARLSEALGDDVSLPDAVDGAAPLSRGDACLVVYRALAE
ncbi:FAD-dependent oxidoreductase [Haloprofundus salilacus]|uniref:FAD-dependent oxidoreductase n=1 Tax=Haloprofundus salilacus TaxID=2876190 RepID=UPI001CCE0926|nr:FAD-dependent oxidoreductase [Haloprofundus salilacus]